MDETLWSIHNECKCLDTTGGGNSTKFWYITHEALTDTVDWEMSNNTHIYHQRPETLDQTGVRSNGRVFFFCAIS